MDIRIESLLGGAEHATGVVGIIDVFRAFSTAAVAIANGALQIIMVSGVEEALALRASGGTRGIAAASRAQRLYAASLVTAKATARGMLTGNPEHITLVAMGKNA